MAEIAADKAGFLGLLDALAVFIKQKRAKIKELKNTLNKYYKDDNSNWASKYLYPDPWFHSYTEDHKNNKKEIQTKRQAVQYIFE